MVRSVADMWQAFEPPGPVADGPWVGTTLARMPDGTLLRLPLRELGDVAVAGLIVNQASFAVFDRLAGWMAERAAALAPEVVVGLPTLGHPLAAAVARALGHANWVAPGTSRKLWYEERLSVPLASITSPGAGRRLWLDPRLVGRLEGRRVLLVDDVISTGASARAGLALLAAAGVVLVGVCVAMAQGERWRDLWDVKVPVVSVFSTPVFRRGDGGWWAA